MIYIDTSVLAAYYCPEPLSEQSQRVLAEEGERAISSLVELELVSALARKVRSREMRLADAHPEAPQPGHITGRATGTP